MLARGALEVQLSESLESVEGHSFWNCRSVKKIHIKSKIFNVSWFAGNKVWEETEVSEDNEKYQMQNNIVYSKDGQTLVGFPTSKTGTFYVPDNVIKIGTSAFNSSQLENVIINDNITTLAESAFQGSKIKQITIGKNVSSIGTAAFYNCSSLEKVILRNTVFDPGKFGACKNWKQIEVNENNEALIAIDNIVYSKDKLTVIACPTGRTGELTIQEGCKKINGSAFKSCIFESLIIPDSLETIGGYSFWGATKLTKIHIGKGVHTIETHAFTTTKIATVTIASPTVAKALTSQTACSNLINNATTIYIKSDITEIGSYVIDNFTIEEVATDDPTYKEGYVKYVKK